MDSTDNKTFIRVLNVDSNGRLQNEMEAKPEPLRCEKDDCSSTEVLPYKRNRLFGCTAAWIKEPIYLCDKHSVNRKPFVQ